jgi:hypothetical protein
MKRRNFVKTTLLTGAANTMSAGLISCETGSITANSNETMTLPAKNVSLLGFSFNTLFY